MNTVKTSGMTMRGERGTAAVNSRWTMRMWTLPAPAMVGVIGIPNGKTATTIEKVQTIVNGLLIEPNMMSPTARKVGMSRRIGSGTRMGVSKEGNLLARREVEAMSITPIEIAMTRDDSGVKMTTEDLLPSVVNTGMIRVFGMTTGLARLRVNVDTLMKGDGNPPTPVKATETGIAKGGSRARTDRPLNVAPRAAAIVMIIAKADRVPKEVDRRRIGMKVISRNVSTPRAPTTRIRIAPRVQIGLEVAAGAGVGARTEVHRAETAGVVTKPIGMTRVASDQNINRPDIVGGKARVIMTRDLVVTRAGGPHRIQKVINSNRRP